MNGKLLDLKITKKNVEMENKLLSKSENYTRNTGKTDKHGRVIQEWAGRSTTLSYKSFTKSHVEFLDEATNETYQVSVIEDDFLPVYGSTIKAYVNDDKKILAYQPYRKASPVILHQNFPDHTITNTIAQFITGLFFAFPLIPIISVYTLREACKKYKNGAVANRLLLNIFLVIFLISFQSYFTYFLYDRGRNYFWEAIAGYLSGGVILATILASSEFQNMLNMIGYQSRIKRQFT